MNQTNHNAYATFPLDTCKQVDMLFNLARNAKMKFVPHKVLLTCIVLEDKSCPLLGQYAIITNDDLLFCPGICEPIVHVIFEVLLT